MAILLTTLFNGIAYGMLLFVMAVGLSITLGMTRFVNLAHVSLCMAGGYVTVTGMAQLGLPFLATLPLALVAVALLGLTLERCRLFNVAVGVLITLAILFGLERTRFGAMVRACVDNRRVATACGLNSDRLFAVTFAVGGGLAGLGGAMAANLVGLDLDLQRGERHAVIGPNGAGKSTFVALVTGLLVPTAGDIRLDGRDITRLSPAQRVAAGLVRTFQINTLFPSLTPLASVVLALCQRDGHHWPSLRPVALRHAQVDEASALLDRFGLADVALTTTAELAYGQQRLLEVALACALKPRVLLLDEPAAGLTTQQGRALFEQLATLAAGTTLLFIEHDMGLVFAFADRVSVLAGGALIAQGPPDEIRRDERVRVAYLGR